MLNKPPKLMKRICFAAALAWAALMPARADTTLVFNEIMYHPATNETVLEWVELYNQMAVDLDIGGWRLDGDVEYTFPTNSRIAGRSYIIVALFPPAMLASTSQTNIAGPFLHRLNNSSGNLILRNQNGRQVDEVSYETSGKWPVAPDGSGVSLAKRDRDAGSKDPANWTSSEQINGTPGTDNFPTGSSVRLIAIDDAFKYEASGTDLGTTWREPGYDDSGWSSRSGVVNRVIPGLFSTGLDANGNAIADGGNDPHYVLSYTAQGTPGMAAIVSLNNAAWLANDPASKWISVVSSGATSINGGGYGYRTTFSLTDFLLNTVRVNFSVAIDNAMTNVFLNGVAQNLNFTGFATYSSPFTLSSGFANGANTLEFGTENQGAGPGAFRALVSGSGLAANTNSLLPSGPVTYYFRRGFNFSGNPNYSTLQINPVVADGAVFYLNGVEVHRQNLPGGTINYTTPAISNVTAVNYSGPITIPATNLVFGPNVLAVEVHQAAASPDGTLIGAELTYVPLAVPPTSLGFNELSATTNATFWLELMNFGTNALALDGMVIRLERAGTNQEYVFPPGVTLNAGSVPRLDE